MFDPAGATLIDSAYGKHAALTEALVRTELQAAQSPGLLRVINTHLHSDHCGGNARLQRTFSCKIRIAQSQAAIIARWDEARMEHTASGPKTRTVQRRRVRRSG